jgi:enoyl-CoA hydratase/carnithine racemase
MFSQSRCHAALFAARDICSEIGDSSVIALLTFLPGQRTVNVIDTEFIAQLRAALEWLQQCKPPVDFALLTSNVPGSFVAGADLKLQTNLTNESEAVAQSAGLLDYTCLFHSMPFVTVALVEGSALGGGLELALACHLCFGRPLWNKHGAEAQCLCLPEVKLGVLPGAGGCVRLPLRIGLLPALNMILQGTSVTVSHASKVGMIDAVWKDDRPTLPGSEPPAEFLPWVVGQLVRKTARSRSSDGLRRNRILSFALWFPPISSLVRRFIRRKIDAKTNGHFPAPYAALDAVMDCWGKSVGTKCKQWPFHFSVEARSCSPESRAFGRVAVSPESKALMSLFLSSKLPAKIPPPHCIPSAAALPNRVLLTFDVEFNSPESSTKALILSLLKSSIQVSVHASLECFELIQSGAKQDLNQNVQKRSMSSHAATECLMRLQRVSDAEALCDDTLLRISFETSKQPQKLPMNLERAIQIHYGPHMRLASVADCTPSLCCIKWSGCISTMAEVIVGHEPVLLIDSAARAASSTASVFRTSGYGVSFTQSSMGAAFEVFCAIFARAVFIVACAAESASAAISAVEFVENACVNAGWDAGPFELADRLGAATLSKLLAEFTAICERQCHVGNGLRVASLVLETLCDSASSCKTFWSFSRNDTRSSIHIGIGPIIKACADHFEFPKLPLTFWSHRFIHLQILMAACESCLTLLQRRAVPNPEILDLLIVASGYPANQGGVIECARNTFALSEYEYMISAGGANALDSLSWRDTYGAIFEWKILVDRPQMMPCQSVSRLSCQSPFARRIR